VEVEVEVGAWVVAAEYESPAKNKIHKDCSRKTKQNNNKNNNKMKK
jgi:hypothetical protein